MFTNWSGLTTYQFEAIIDASNNRTTGELSQKIQGLKATVAKLLARVNTLADTVSIMEKTIRMVLIANWDQLAVFRGNRLLESLLLLAKSDLLTETSLSEDFWELLSSHSYFARILASSSSVSSFL